MELKEETIGAIDRCLLGHTGETRRPSALLVGLAMSDLRRDFGSIPGDIYADRIRQLAANGLLEHRGDLQYIGLSDVRATARDAADQSTE